MSNRIYFRFVRAWHAETAMWPTTHGSLADWITSLCGLTPHRRYPGLVTADRLPPDGHLCGNCARVIAARRDIEP